MGFSRTPQLCYLCRHALQGLPYHSYVLIRIERYIMWRGSFAGGNVCELLEVRLLQFKHSRIVGNNNDMPIDNNAVVLKETFAVKTFVDCPDIAKFAGVRAREGFPLCGSCMDILHSGVYTLGAAILMLYKISSGIYMACI